MYAWEGSFERKILEIREKEVKMLKQIAYINTAVSFLWTAAPFLVNIYLHSFLLRYTFINLQHKNIVFVNKTTKIIMMLNISKMLEELSLVDG